MLNPNTKPVLTFEEKRNAGGVPVVIFDFDDETDVFTLSADQRYYDESADTDFIDLDYFQVPLCAITCFFDQPFDDPKKLEGTRLLLPHIKRST